MFDESMDPSDPKSVVGLMKMLTSKKSSMISGMEGTIDGHVIGMESDEDNPYSSKGRISGKSGGLPRLSQAAASRHSKDLYASKESFLAIKSSIHGGAAVNFEDESDLTPQELREKQRRELELRA